MDEVLDSISNLRDGSTPEAVPAGQSTDPASIEPLVKDLFRLLNDDDTEATEVLEKLVAQLTESDAVEKLKSIEGSLGEYDFDGASEILQSLAQDLDIQID